MSANSHLTHIFISPESNYWSHKMGEPGSAPTHKPESVECHQNKGIVGDRFYNFKADYKGQVSLMEAKALSDLAEKLKINELDESVFRRNFIVTDVELLPLIGKTFRIGEVQFEGMVDCAPCPWMDMAAGEGAFAWLKENQKGGLRAKVLSSGVVRLGDKLIL